MKLLIILGDLFDFSLFFFWIWSLKCYKDVLNEDIKVATLTSIENPRVCCFVLFTKVPF